MRTSVIRGLVCVVVLLLARALALAHDPLLDLPPPTSEPEAWNVINASVANIEKLFETNQLPVIAFHVANCSPAIRTLQAKLPASPDADADARRAELQQMFELGGELIVATREESGAREKGMAKYADYRERWRRIAERYPAHDRDAAVYVCPMHPLDRHLAPDARCTACGMTLVRRRIPASVVYEKPGEPSMQLVATPDRPLRKDRRAKVKVRLTRLSDGAPLREEDLLVMHTERIHLLIVDGSLHDYHHVHPTPTKVPGEYQFEFTPRKPGPYRAWADVVPAESVVQEYVVADIRSDAGGEPVGDRAARSSDVVDGRRYELKFDHGDKPMRAGESVRGRLTVTGADGTPFAKLEPIMGAYAHLVGFADDYRTVVHLHPQGPDPTRPSDRGGPTLQFTFYPPVAGYVRLYAQVQIDGQSHFARFGVNVAPAADDAAR